MNQVYLDAEDVQKILKVPQSSAYAVIRTLNAELKQKGYLTIRGRCPTKYLLERYGLGADHEK